MARPGWAGCPGWRVRVDAAPGVDGASVDADFPVTRGTFGLSELDEVTNALYSRVRSTNKIRNNVPIRSKNIMTTTTTASIAGHPRRWLILALVLCAECMDMLDSSIVNVAAPTIRTDLHTSASALEWVIGGYALMFAVVLITVAHGQYLRRRRLFAAGATGFVVASGRVRARGLARDADRVPAGAGWRCRARWSRRAWGSSGRRSPNAIPLGVRRVRTRDRPVGGARADRRRRARLGQRVRHGLAPDLLVNLPLGLAAAIGAAWLMPNLVSPILRGSTSSVRHSPPWRWGSRLSARSRDALPAGPRGRS